MAKVKKKEALSLEEKLEQALVLVDEQPYEVPENWCWTKMEAVCNGFQYGYTEKAVYEEVGPKYIRITDIGDGVINDEKAPYCPIDDKSYELYKIHKDDIFIARMGSVGENGLALTDLDAVFASYLIRLVPKISAKFITFYLQSGLYWGQISEKSQGTTRLNVNANVLRMLMLPLPPLAEQQRIVEQIESLFVKLDEAKDKVLEVITSSQCRKDSLLHKAFEGVLTCRWREKNNVVLENKYYSFDECIQKMQNGLAKRSGSIGKEFVVIRLANLSTDGFITEDLRMILLDEKEQENYRLYVDDVVMIRVNGSKDNVARQICVESDTEWTFCDHIIRIKYDKAKVLPRFMVYFAKSQYYRNYIADNMVSSAGQNTISRKGMSNLRVPKFVLEEQEEIIKILGKLWKSEDEIQSKAEQVVEQIDLMKKSILAKAFRGELGTNNPDEESAVELLKQIIL